MGEMQPGDEDSGLVERRWERKHRGDKAGVLTEETLEGKRVTATSSTATATCSAPPEPSAATTPASWWSRVGPKASRDKPPSPARPALTWSAGSVEPARSHSPFLLSRPPREASTRNRPRPMGLRRGIRGELSCVRRWLIDEFGSNARAESIRLMQEATREADPDDPEAARDWLIVDQAIALLTSDSAAARN